MAPTAGSPLTWTLRFKYQKKTILLHVDPIQSFSSIKTELLRALRQTHPSGEISSGVNIPSNPSDVLLAQPKDLHDPAQGWTKLQFDHDNNEDDAAKPASKKSKGRTTFAEDSPNAAGLKDGAMLAFKFRSDGAAMADEDEALGLDEDDEEWDVTLPDFDDAGDAPI